MHSHNHYGGIDPRIVSITRRKAKELIQHRLFLDSDLEDIEQELMMDLLNELEHYNSSKSSLYHFARQIVESKAKNLLRNRSRKKRGSETLLYSLHDPVENNEDQLYLLIDAISTSADIFNDNGNDLSIQEQIELKHDIKRAISKSSADLTELAQLLQTMNITEIVEITGISRSTIHRAIKKLRIIFSDLDDYL